jgi:hypothetical protein
VQAAEKGLRRLKRRKTRIPKLACPDFCTKFSALQEGRFPGFPQKWKSVFDSFIDVYTFAQGGFFFHANEQNRSPGTQEGK